MEIEVIDTYEVKGKGKALVVKNDVERTRDELGLYWIGKFVNGKRVIGIESHAVPVIFKGAYISLLVEQ